jgi:hypothetical protein
MEGHGPAPLRVLAGAGHGIEGIEDFAELADEALGRPRLGRKPRDDAGSGCGLSHARRPCRSCYT